MKQDYMKLCLVTDTDSIPLAAYPAFLEQALQGGVSVVQLREKTKNPQQVREIALMLKSILAPYNVPLIINDHVELAKAIDADGIHLGQSDWSPSEARRLLGPDKIIGWSIETMAQLDFANQTDCIDYVAASAVFVSVSKTNCKTIWGLDGLQAISQKSTHPVMAVGGINTSNVQSVISSGACGVAVISAIHGQKNPPQAARDLMMKINHALECQSPCLKM